MNTKRWQINTRAANRESQSRKVEWESSGNPFRHTASLTRDFPRSDVLARKRRRPVPVCGKFTQMMTWTELHTLASVIGAPEGPHETVTPMRFGWVIRLDDAGKRETAKMRWGFARASANTPMERPDHIHARAETIDSKLTFRDAFLHTRGILVVKTFNAGKEITPTRTEQHTIAPRDGKPIAIAVLWEEWRNRNEGRLLTFVMVTVPSNALIGTVTDRMPAILQPEDWAKWLGEVPATPDELKALLRPYEGDWTMAPEKPVNPSPPEKPDSQPTLF